MIRLALTFALLAPAAHADIFGNTYRSAEWGVDLTVPRGWELSEQRSYPGILVRGFDHKSGARLLLSAERLTAEETVRSYAERNQKGLLKIGYRVTGATAREGGAIVVDGQTPDGKKLIRQAYFVVPAVILGGPTATGYVLSVSIQASAAKQSRPFEAFDEAMRTINIAPPASQPAEAPPQ